MSFPCGHDRPTPPCRHCAIAPSRSSRRHFLRFLGAGAVAAVSTPLVTPVMIQVPSNYVRVGVGDDAIEFSFDAKTAFWLAT